MFSLIWKATSRTYQSILNRDKIGIFGDYDVDGATSTALLGNYLSELNLEYKTYIPDRKKDMGQSVESFKELINQGVKLIFTVDCGTLSFDAINLQRKQYRCNCFRPSSFEIKLPKAFSIINPNRLDDNSNLQYL